MNLSAEPDQPVLKRHEAIAVHELGHALGLADQPCSHGPCVMCGEVEQDCVDEHDAGRNRPCALADTLTSEW